MRPEQQTTNHLFSQLLQKGAALAVLFFLCSTVHGQGLFGDFFSSGLANESNQVELKWEDSGKHKLLRIIPKGNDETPIDIKIENGMISISGKIVKEEVVERNGVKSKSRYMSQFSQSYNLPTDIDETKADIKQDKKTILVTFPKIKGKSKKGLEDANDLPGEVI